ncbi:MAG: transporter substrate-binding domain-containing protein [Fibrobacterales bacterium]
MYSRIFLLHCIVILMIAPLPLIAQDTITIAVGEWDPYISKDLKNDGVIAQIISEAFALEGVSAEFEYLPWQRALVEVKHGTKDATPGWSPVEERKADFYFTDSFMDESMVFFHLKDTLFDWKEISDLSGRAIGGVNYYNYLDDFEKAEKAGIITVDRTSSELLNFKKLLSGRISIFPVDRNFGYSLIYKNFTPQQVARITHHNTPLYSEPVVMLMSKKIPQSKRFLSLFNKGLKRLKKSGRFEELFKSSQRGEFIIKK